MSSLVQTSGTYLNRIVNSFMEILPSLALDLLNFYQNPEKTNKMVADFPCIEDNMKPFIQTCSLVLLSLVNEASKPYITKNFFNRPSILASILDSFDKLDSCIKYPKPFLSYF